MKRNKGFTLIELLVVFVIIGVLAGLGSNTYLSSLKKSRDGKRKASLQQLNIALESYANDHSQYPSASSDLGGKIKACGCKAAANADVCDWDEGGTGSKNVCDENNTVYMEKVPTDPGGGMPSFCYKIGTGNKSYQIYAKLENTQDPDCLSHDDSGTCVADKTCGGNSYNYGVSSSNTLP